MSQWSMLHTCDVCMCVYAFDHSAFMLPPTHTESASQPTNQHQPSELYNYHNYRTNTTSCSVICTYVLRCLCVCMCCNMMIRRNITNTGALDLSIGIRDYYIRVNITLAYSCYTCICSITHKKPATVSSFPTPGEMSVFDLGVSDHVPYVLISCSFVCLFVCLSVCGRIV